MDARSGLTRAITTGKRATTPTIRPSGAGRKPRFAAHESALWALNPGLRRGDDGIKGLFCVRSRGIKNWGYFPARLAKKTADPANAWIVNFNNGNTNANNKTNDNNVVRLVRGGE